MDETDCSETGPQDKQSPRLCFLAKQTKYASTHIWPCTRCKPGVVTEDISVMWTWSKGKKNAEKKNYGHLACEKTAKRSTTSSFVYSNNETGLVNWATCCFDSNLLLTLCSKMYFRKSVIWVPWKIHLEKLLITSACPSWIYTCFWINHEALLDRFH